jgi:hypothetical protein
MAAIWRQWSTSASLSASPDLGEALERSHRREQLDRARRIEVLGAAAKPVLHQTRPAGAVALDHAEHDLQAKLGGALDDR